MRHDTRVVVAALAMVWTVFHAPPAAAQQGLAVGVRARVTQSAPPQSAASATGAEPVVKGRVTRIDRDSIWLDQPADYPTIAVGWRDAQKVEVASRRWGRGALIGAGVGAAVGGVALVQCLLAPRCDGIAIAAPIAFAFPGMYLGLIFAPTRWTTLPVDQLRRAAP